MINEEEKKFMFNLEARLGLSLTDEQEDFIKDFRQSTVSFSLPGTGKTTSIILGILKAQLYYNVNGENIYCSSFTNEATNQLRVKYQEACKTIGAKPSVNFFTLHSLCSNILKNNYERLGMTNISIGESLNHAQTIEYFKMLAESRGINLDIGVAKNIYKAILSLNSSLIFDKEHVFTKSVYKDCNVSYDLFLYLRKKWFDMNKLTNCIPVSCILLYTLELLLRFEDIREEFSNKCEIMIIDEFQDMSLLQLKLVSLLSKVLIANGDIRQQIYTFNGACQEIVDKYKEYYPKHREVTLSQSFRCGKAIVNFATPIILPNKIGGQEFKGKEGLIGRVDILNTRNFEEIVKKVSIDYENNGRIFKDKILFLFRNNLSAVYIAELLYKYKLPFRVNNYTPAPQVPIIKDLTDMIELCKNPKQTNYLNIVHKILPEFRKYATLQNHNDSPLVQIMNKTGCSVLEIPYEYKRPEDADILFTNLLELSDLLDNPNTMCKELYNKAYTAYNFLYLRTEGWRFPEMPEYYFRQVQDIFRCKNYNTMIKEELEKKEIIDTNLQFREGIQCITFHASKGLEADIVYLLDCDDTIIAKDAVTDKLMRNGCQMEAAKEIRNERCLLYVACTRAKKYLGIHYNTKLSPLFRGDNTYSSLDRVYENGKKFYNDVEAFLDFSLKPTKELVQWQ